MMGAKLTAVSKSLKLALIKYPKLVPFNNVKKVQNKNQKNLVTL